MPSKTQRQCGLFASTCDSSASTSNRVYLCQVSTGPGQGYTADNQKPIRQRMGFLFSDSPCIFSILPIPQPLEQSLLPCVYCEDGPTDERDIQQQASTGSLPLSPLFPCPEEQQKFPPPLARLKQAKTASQHICLQQPDTKHIYLPAGGTKRLILNDATHGE